MNRRTPFAAVRQRSMHTKTIELGHGMEMLQWQVSVELSRADRSMLRGRRVQCTAGGTAVICVIVV